LGKRSYVGPYKLIGQAELRKKLVETAVLGQRFNHGAAVFSDVAWIGAPEDGAPL
jgi:hypothetical protein